MSFRDSPVLFQTVLDFKGDSEDEADRVIEDALARSAALSASTSSNETCATTSVLCGEFERVGMYAGREMTAFHLAVYRGSSLMARSLLKKYPKFIEWSCKSSSHRGRNLVLLEMMVFQILYHGKVHVNVL